MNESARVFGWREWPFRIVADEQFARVWADRSELRLELDRRIRRLKAVPHSTVQVIWADFGAGKSHTLRRLEAICRDDEDGRLLPVYTDIPVGAIGMIDLYRRLMGSLQADLLSAISERARAVPKRRPTTPGARDLLQALKLLGSEDTGGQALAAEWMQASPGLPHLKSVKAYGISGRIEDDLRVVEVVTELLSLIRESRAGSSLVWLIDEFQRVADVPVRKREAFAKSIVSLFNSCPVGLHFVLSFSVAQQSMALALLPPDLQSRAKTFPMLMMPQMSREDCFTFSEDLFDAFRIQARAERSFPFTAEALNHVIADLEDDGRGVATPRLLMERLETVLFEVFDTSQGSEMILPIEVDTASSVMARIRSRS